MNKQGSAIISNTHIREVSNLLYKDNIDRSISDENTWNKLYWERRNSEWNKNNYITDLFAFIDCIILNDKLYTLPAKIVGQKSTLWDILIKENLVEIIDTSGIAVDIGEIIISRLSQINKFNKLVDQDNEFEKDLINKNEIFSQINDFLNNRSVGKDEEHRLSDYYNFDIVGGSSKIVDADNFEELAKELVGWMDYAGSGTYQACTSVLRDMYYIVAAEILEMPYYPQSTRIEFAEKFPNYYDISFKTRLYKCIAKALDETIADVYDDFKEKVAFIPPFSSIVLDQSNKPEDIIKVALNLRNDFEKTRKGFNELTEARKNSGNLKERARISRQQRKLLEDASKSFNNLSRIDLKTSIKFIPEVVNHIIEPTSALNLSSRLLKQPVDLILKWWSRRPILKMYSIKDKVFEIQQYHTLLEKFFPDEGNGQKHYF